ncbi:MAG TPA: hypothetical protein VIJ22_09465 [Polyangiaceae bacterium]
MSAASLEQPPGQAPIAAMGLDPRTTTGGASPATRAAERFPASPTTQGGLC